jgi:hypothetical protein
MSEPTVCSICGVWNDHHDYEHLARECYPKRIEELERVLRPFAKVAADPVLGSLPNPVNQCVISNAEGCLVTLADCIEANSILGEKP